MGLSHDRPCVSASWWFCCHPRLEICCWSLMRRTTGLPAVPPSHSLDACLCRRSPAPLLLLLPPVFLISLPCRCISEARCVLPPPSHPPPVPISISDLRCFFFPHFLSRSHKMSVTFPLASPLSSPLSSASRVGLVSSLDLSFFYFFFFFSARCHHHLINSGLFDYVLCPWLFEDATGERLD